MFDQTIHMRCTAYWPGSPLTGVMPYAHGSLPTLNEGRGKAMPCGVSAYWWCSCSSLSYSSFRKSTCRAHSSAAPSSAAGVVACKHVKHASLAPHNACRLHTSCHTSRLPRRNDGVRTGRHFTSICGKPGGKTTSQHPHYCQNGLTSPNKEVIHHKPLEQCDLSSRTPTPYATGRGYPQGITPRPSLTCSAARSTYLDGRPWETIHHKS